MYYATIYVTMRVTVTKRKFWSTRTKGKYNNYNIKLENNFLQQYMYSLVIIMQLKKNHTKELISNSAQAGFRSREVWPCHLWKNEPDYSQAYFMLDKDWVCVWGTVILTEREMQFVPLTSHQSQKQEQSTLIKRINIFIGDSQGKWQLTLREEILLVGLNYYLNEVPCSVASSCYQPLHFGFLQLTWFCWIFGLPILAGPLVKNPLNCTIDYFIFGLYIIIRQEICIYFFLYWIA